MIDFHSHILPEMDDGSSSVEESVRMLGTYSERITDLCLTPHFYAFRDRPERFLEKRAASYERLVAAISGLPHPRLHLGGEVYFFDGISRSEKMKDFRIGDTRLILIEMPFGEWNERMIRELLELRREYGLQPVLAHIDRYDFGGGARKKCMEIFLSGGGLVQANAEPCFSFFGRKNVISGIEKGKIHFLGSDAHNMEDRKPNLDGALDILTAKADVADRLAGYEARYFVSDTEAAL